LSGIALDYEAEDRSDIDPSVIEKDLEKF